MNQTRPSFICLAALLLALNHQVSGQGLTISTSDEAVAKAISRELPAPYTGEELATPPVGEIRKLHLRSVISAKELLEAALKGVSAEDRADVNFGIATSAALKIQSLLHGRQQDQLFSLMEDMVVLYEAAGDGDNPEFVHSAYDALSQMKAIMIEEIAAYIARQNAVVPAEKLSLFVDAFTRGFVFEMGMWEDRSVPISDDAFMLIDAAAVVAQLKTQPWENADRYLGGATPAQAFSEYELSGAGSAVLKAKYEANKQSIDAKWNELADWVAKQRAVDAANES